VYEAEGNDPQTYLLLYRHADLVLQKLQTHPDRHQPHNRKALNAATTTVYSDLKKLESIAPRIKKRHEEYQERRSKQQEALKVLEGREARTLSQELAGLSVQDRGSKRTSYDSRPTIDAQENHSLATRLAQREVKRRDTARRSVRQAGVSEEEEQQRRTGGNWESWQHDLAQDGDRGDIMHQIQEVARLQQNAGQTSIPAVSFENSLHWCVTDKHSNLPTDTRIATTTRPYRTNPPRDILPSFVTLTRDQRDLPRNKFTDPPALPPSHHLFHPSRS
jgi:STAM-binding protein